ncbi:CLUMA_CG020951, isoform A [Clunio marinus]|uniref:Inositol-1-monophosphatase n=1 Tax=Clunio marinus TaxID=568069 RepID=A0A1J1J6F6_9DIPT|nr:CLUMA_CG020951, isoform A [Clunio marinus]
MTPEELNECYSFVKQLVQNCGEIFKEGFKNTGIVSNKGDAYDLVTFWDGEIEKILIDGIKTKYPNHKFIAEEDSAASGEKVLSSDPTWIIDPIDGTINYVNKLNLVCISVALSVEEDVKLAILFSPTLNELYTARKGQGAYLNGERIEASKKRDLRKCLLAHEISLGTHPLFLPKYLARAEVLLPTCLGLRSLGSAALTLGRFVAKGAIDAYNIEDLKPWDIAAGALIVQEAGGVVIDINGGNFNVMKPNIIAAGTQEVADDIKEILNSLDASLKLQGKYPKTR